MGCSNCDPEYGPVNYGQALGYVVLWAWDDAGPYTYLGRCYYCNHPRR